MDLNALEQNYQFRVQNGMFQDPLQSKPTPKKKKNFFLDQISTAGGILGGIGGSFIAPIAGTAGGAAAGSALGEALENLISGESVGKNVAKEAALGGVFGAGPIKLLKGGAALATGKGIQGASQAALTPLRAKAGQALTNSADDLAVKQFRLTPTQLNNFSNKFKEDAGTTIRKYGFQSADDITAKGIEPLQQQFDEAITSIPGVTKASLQKNIESRIGKLTASGPSDMQAIGSQLKKESDTFLKNYGDVIPANELNQIRRQFDDLVNYTEKTTNPARYGVNKRMADALRETLQSADPSGNLKNVGRELQKLRQLSDNVSKQGQVGRGSLPMNLPTLLGGGMGAAAGGPLAAAGAAVTTAAVNSPTGRRMAMTGAERLGSRLSNSGAKAAGQSNLGIVGRVGSVGALNGMAGQAPAQNSLEDALLNQSLENSAINPTNAPSANPMSSADMQGQYQNEQDMSSPYTRENLMSDIQRDPANSNKYMEYYANLQEIFAAPESKEKPLSAEASKVLSNAQIGLSALDDFESEITRDPSILSKRIIPGRGALGGAVGGVLGTRGADAAAGQIVDVIARLRTGAAITNDEAKRFETFIPQAGDPQNVQRQKLNYLRNQFEMVANRSTTGGGTDLESALMQQYAQ